MILCNFLVRKLQYYFKNTYFFAHENMKKPTSKVGCFKKILACCLTCPKVPISREIGI